MASKRKSYRGLPAEHRSEAKYHLKSARGTARLAQARIRAGLCRQAMEMLERTAMYVGHYEAHRGEVPDRRGLLGRPTLTSMLRRLNSQFNAKCLR
jgi:hypothetical protein